MNLLNQVLGTRISQLRIARRNTQLELADALGVGRTTITNIEAGAQSVTLEMLYRLADHFGIHPRDLLPEPSILRGEMSADRFLAMGLSSRDATILASAPGSRK
jgi:putative transcriptional regulator